MRISIDGLEFVLVIYSPSLSKAFLEAYDNDDILAMRLISFSALITHVHSQYAYESLEKGNSIPTDYKSDYKKMPNAELTPSFFSKKLIVYTHKWKNNDPDTKEIVKNKEVMAFSPYTGTAKDGEVWDPPMLSDAGLSFFMDPYDFKYPVDVRMATDYYEGNDIKGISGGGSLQLIKGIEGNASIAYIYGSGFGLYLSTSDIAKSYVLDIGFSFTEFSGKYIGDDIPSPDGFTGDGYQNNVGEALIVIYNWGSEDWEGNGAGYSIGLLPVSGGKSVTNTIMIWPRFTERSQEIIGKRQWRDNQKMKKSP